MSTAPHSPAAFINNIADEGTKAEAIAWLQKTWNELVQARKQIEAMQPVVNAASILETAWSSDDEDREHCEDEEEALIDAVFAYRTKLAGSAISTPLQRA